MCDPVETEFKENVLRLVEDLYTVTQHPLALIAHLYFTCEDASKMVRVFHERCTGMIRQRVRQRDERFFRESARHLFGADACASHIGTVLDIYDRNDLSDLERRTIWNYFDHFIDLSDTWYAQAIRKDV